MCLIECGLEQISPKEESMVQDLVLSAQLSTPLKVELIVGNEESRISGSATMIHIYIYFYLLFIVYWGWGYLGLG